jgi:predicted nucleotidyltransferase
MKFGLSEKTILEICNIFRKFPEVEKAILYGSRAKGNFREASDIDLTLIGQDLNFDILTKINIAFDDSFLPYKFDISIFDKLEDPDFINHIERIGVLFYQKN